MSAVSFTKELERQHWHLKKENERLLEIQEHLVAEVDRWKRRAQSKARASPAGLVRGESFLQAEDVGEAAQAAAAAAGENGKARVLAEATMAAAAVQQGEDRGWSLAEYARQYDQLLQVSNALGDENRIWKNKFRTSQDQLADVHRKFLAADGSRKHAEKRCDSLASRLTKCQVQITELRLKWLAGFIKNRILQRRVDAKAKSGKRWSQVTEADGGPPEGVVTLGFTDVQNSTRQWEANPADMHSAILKHNILLRSLLKTHNGYEVKSEGDALMVAFHSPVDALQWCLSAQTELLALDWPEGLLETEDAKETTSAQSKSVIYRGLRVRMGIHIGEPTCHRDARTGLMDYLGRVPNRAARVASAAHGGQILVSGATWNAIQQQIRLDELDVVYHDLGMFRLKGLDSDEQLIQVLPTELSTRTFPPIASVADTGSIDNVIQTLEDDFEHYNESLAMLKQLAQDSNEPELPDPQVSEIPEEPDDGDEGQPLSDDEIKKIAEAALLRQSGGSLSATTGSPPPNPAPDSAPGTPGSQRLLKADSATPSRRGSMVLFSMGNRSPVPAIDSTTAKMDQKKFVQDISLILSELKEARTKLTVSKSDNAGLADRVRDLEALVFDMELSYKEMVSKWRALLYEMYQVGMVLNRQHSLHAVHRPKTYADGLDRLAELWQVVHDAGTWILGVVQDQLDPVDRLHLGVKTSDDTSLRESVGELPEVRSRLMSTASLGKFSVMSRSNSLSKLSQSPPTPTSLRDLRPVKGPKAKMGDSLGKLPKTPPSGLRQSLGSLPNSARSPSPNRVRSLSGKSQVLPKV